MIPSDHVLMHNGPVPDIYVQRPTKDVKPRLLVTGVWVKVGRLFCISLCYFNCDEYA